MTKMKSISMIFMFSLLVMLLVCGGRIGEVIACDHGAGWGHDGPVTHLVRPEEIKGMIVDLSNISGYGIRSGIHAGPKGVQAANYILRKLQHAGLKAHLEGPITATSPWPNDWKVTAQVQGGAPKEIFCIPGLWTAGTTPEGIQAELAYVGTGEASYFNQINVQGKIVLIDGKSPQGYQTTYGGALNTAVQKGAIGAIVTNLQIPVPKLSQGVGRMSALFPIPVVICGKPDGDYLRGLANSGNTVTVKMMLDLPYTVYNVNSNVVAELPGNGSTNEIIAVVGHYDTMFTGALDNNCGVAFMIGLAKYFAHKPRASRNRDMIFLFAFGHDSGYLSLGHDIYVQQHLDIMDKVIVFNIDHPASTSYAYDEIKGLFVPTDQDTIRLYNATSNPLLTICSFSLYRNGMLPAITNAPIGTAGVGSGVSGFINAGTPVLFSGIQLPYYYHTIDDTPDKITVEQIKRSFPGHVEMVENIDSTAEGYLIWADITQKRVIPNTPPEVRIEVLSDTVKVGDLVQAWNDSYFFYDDKPDYYYPQLPSWAGMTWDWGDGTPVTVGLGATHTYTIPGTYTITLTLTDLQNTQGTDTRTITVLP
jgi:hypothetical protein